MIIQFGTGDQSAYGTWPKDVSVFISRPYFKIVLNSGLGVYILNAFKFNIIPKCYARTLEKSHWVVGFSFMGWIFEAMWNKAFVK
jgi:hypothetical protein